MSATDIKTTLYRQIDGIQKEEDLQDLLLTVNEFLSHRSEQQTESPALIAQLERALESVKAGNTRSNEDVMKKTKEWLTQ